MGISVELNSLTNLVLFKIYLLSLLCLLILKIRNHLSFVISTIHLLDSTVLNYNKSVTELDIETIIPDS